MAFYLPATVAWSWKYLLILHFYIRIMEPRSYDTEWYESSIIKQRGGAISERQVRAEDSPRPMLKVRTHNQPHKHPLAPYLKGKFLGLTPDPLVRSSERSRVLQSNHELAGRLALWPQRP